MTYIYDTDAMDEKEGVEISVVDQYGAPDYDDELHSDIPEDKKEEIEGLESTTATADSILEGTTLNQWQAQGDVEAQTDAAVADGKTRPRPARTIGEEDENELDQRNAQSHVEYGDVAEEVETSVINQYHAPKEEYTLHSDIPQSKKSANEGLESTTAAAAADLEGESLVQPVAEGDVESQTDAAVADGKTRPSPALTVGEEENGFNPNGTQSYNTDVAENVATSVVNQYHVPDEEYTLHSDIPQSKKSANEGLESTSAAAAVELRGESLDQWQAQGDVQSETDAAVADGKTSPRPARTVGEEDENELDQTIAQSYNADVAEHVATSVVNQYHAPDEEYTLHSDIPQSKKSANEGLESTSAAAAADLEGESLVQPVAEGDVESQTDAAVADGKTKPSPALTVGEEENYDLDQGAAESAKKGSIDYELTGITTSVVDQEAAPATADLLHSDIPETKQEAGEGLESSTAAATADLEGESLVQPVAEGDAESETDAAVADGLTELHPELTVGEEESGEIE